MQSDNENIYCYINIKQSEVIRKPIYKNKVRTKLYFFLLQHVKLTLENVGYRKLLTTEITLAASL